MVQKILQFLEKTVEWFALGLGMLFLAYTVWAYIVTPPVTGTFRTFNNQSLVVQPGNADALVRSNEAEPLEAAIHDTTVPQFHVENFGDIIDQKLAMSRQPAQLSEIFNALPGPATVTAPPPEAGSQIVMVQPTVPAASALGVYGGLSTVQINPSLRKDVNWVTVVFDIDPTPLHQAWLASFGPIDAHGNGKLTQQQMQTFFLNVKLYRSEQQGTGWSDEVEIPRPSNDTLNAYPPAGSTHRAEQADYINWASNNGALIVAPPALPVTAGTPWNSPASLFGGGGSGQPTEAPPVVAPPTTAPSTAPSTAPATAPTTTPTTAPGGASSSNIPHSHLTMAHAANVYADRTPQNIFADPPAGPPPAAGAAGAAPVAMPDVLSLDAVVVKSQFTPATPPASPAASFNPAGFDASAPGILIYLNDLTALPGKTYRYKIVYQLRNPLFGLPPEHVGDKSWVDQMELTSPASDYTPPITIKRHSLFFCDQARTNNSSQPFPFDVVSWSDGSWRETIFRGFPGDMIGDSGATYVSGTHDPDTESTRIVSVDDNGVISVRDAAGDSTGKQRKDVLDYLKNAGQAPPPASLPPATGAPGNPPRGPGDATPQL